MNVYNSIIIALLFFTFIIGLISVLVVSLKYKWDLTEQELQILKKESNRQCVIAIIIQLGMPAILFPINNVLAERGLLATFLVLFLCIVFSFYTSSRIMQCFLLSKEIKKKKYKQKAIHDKHRDKAKIIDTENQTYPIEEICK